MAFELFDKYMAYVGNTESPHVYHRWTLISMLGAYLGRNIAFPFGHEVVYPNQYIILMGPAGGRKSTAISIGKRVFKEAGYSSFAPDKVSKEQFVVELEKAGAILDEEYPDVQDLSTLVLEKPSELYVCASELADFLGQKDSGFLSLLTNLWDNQPEYKNPKRTAKDIKVSMPTVSILGATTASLLLSVLPAEAIGGGFTSRVIFIHAEGARDKITLPDPPNLAAKEALLSHLKDIRACFSVLNTRMSLAPGAYEEALDPVYQKAVDINDHRFQYYSSRRFTHLLKIAIIIAASRLSYEISKEDIVTANTILFQAERSMPRALGEFGKSRHNEVMHQLLEYLAVQDRPVTHKDLWKLVHKDLEKQSQLTEIILGLRSAERIQVINNGYMIRKEAERSWPPELLDFNVLTDEERI